jgi:3-oxoadipate enol-lactonase
MLPNLLSTVSAKHEESAALEVFVRQNQDMNKRIKEYLCLRLILNKMRSIGKNIDITVNKVTFNYNDEGAEQQPVIIFIHGLALNKDMWSRQEDALKNEYRVIAYDVRGHGKSQMGKEEFSIELFADDLIHFMDMLEIDQTALCGLSMGGYIVLRAMEKYPERFTALILSDTQCIADSAEARERRMKAIEDIQQNGKVPFADQNAKNLFSPESFTTRKGEIEAVKAMTTNMQAEAICQTLNALANRDETCSRLNEIKIPVLILVGKDDKFTPPERSQFMHSKIKNSELHIIDRAAHLSNVENAEEFNRSLKDFLKKVL